MVSGLAAAVVAGVAVAAEVAGTVVDTWPGMVSAMPTASLDGSTIALAFISASTATSYRLAMP